MSENFLISDSLKDTLSRETLYKKDLTEILTHFSTQNLTGKYLEMLTDTYAKALIQSLKVTNQMRF